MERFIHELNLARYVDLLESETDPAKREQLHKLLVEEEDRFGGRLERLEQADSLIAGGAERLRRQQALLARLRGDGRDTTQAEILVANITDGMALIVQYREMLLDGLDRSRL